VSIRFPGKWRKECRITEIHVYAVNLLTEISKSEEREYIRDDILGADG